MTNKIWSLLFVFILGLFLGSIFNEVGLKTIKKNGDLKKARVYPLAELFTAISYTVIICVYDFNFSLELVTQLVFVTFMIIFTVSDLEEKIVSNKVIAIGVFFVLVLRVINGDRLAYFLISGVSVFLFLSAMFFLSKEKIGGADVKIYTLVGLSIGFAGAVRSLFFASFLALFFNLGNLKRENREEEIAFVPFITAGVVLTYFL